MYYKLLSIINLSFIYLRHPLYIIVINICVFPNFHSTLTSLPNITIKIVMSKLNNFFFIVMILLNNIFIRHISCKLLFC